MDKSNVQLLGWGAVLVFADLHIRGIDIIPDIIGLPMMIVACFRLAMDSHKFQGAANGLIVAGVASIGIFLLRFTGGLGVGVGVFRFLHAMEFLATAAAVWLIWFGFSVAPASQKITVLPRMRTATLVYVVVGLIGLVVSNVLRYPGRSLGGFEAVLLLIGVAGLIAAVVWIFGVFQISNSLDDESSGVMPELPESS